MSGLSATQVANVAAIEIGDIIALNYQPGGVGTVIDRILIVEGISHTVTPYTHKVVLNVQADVVASEFTFDDDVLGLFDGDGLFAI